YLGTLCDVNDAERSQTTKPDDHDRAECHAYCAGAAFLDKKQSGQDDNGNGENVALELMRNQVQTLDCRKHRDRRSDHAVTIKQCCGKKTERGDEPFQFGPVRSEFAYQG